MRIAIQCPHCERDLIEDARELLFVHGLLIAIRYGNRRYIGCTRCVRRKVIRNIIEVSLTGWWSLRGVLVTPFVLLQNIFRLVAGSNEALLRSVLEGIGIDVEEVRVDAYGRTREQDRMANCILDVLAEAVWVNGEPDNTRTGAAASVAASLVGDVFSPDEVFARLRLLTRASIPNSVQLNPDRVVLLRAALSVVVPSGALAGPEFRFIWDLAKRLNLQQTLVEDLLREVGVGPGAGRGTGAGAGTRTSSARSSPVLERAAAILQIPSTATQRQAKAAYRRQALKHHPDRAGRDQQAAAQANSRMAELNWAYEQFSTGGEL
jgi:hypothetical protein